jgi:FkbH-like protein
MEALKKLIDEGRLEDAWQTLVEQSRSATNYTEFVSLCRWHKRLGSPTNGTGRKIVRIALLGGASTEMIESPLWLAVEAVGLGCQIHRSDFNTLAAEMLDAESATAAFEPEVAVIVTTPANLPMWPSPGDGLERVRQLADEACNYWLDLCARLHDHTGCEIILNNFHQLPTRPFGNMAAKLPWDANNFMRRINLELGARAPAYVHINDVESLAAQHGVRQWFDTRYWFHAKQPVSFECLVPYVRNTARIVGALFGRTAKCLVLDLDNTLWGGVVGDDGYDGIVFGEGDAVGEAFKAFQEYILMLKQRGVLLAVCSKNEETNALAPFTQRPDMVLNRDDFVSFKANWQPKPDNLREIAAELNIGLDSLVFVDDNRVEREYVRQRLPEVNVIELSEDPSDYPQLLDDAGFFEVTAFSAEDRQRTLQYQENTKREKLLETAADYADYLRTLEQRAVIGPFAEGDLNRITQLINKSNQFNLTTMRLGRSQVEELMIDSDVLTASVRLTDRFGDNGLISVLSARRQNGHLRIDEWLMSCRVLKRGVEQVLCNYVVEQARSFGATYVLGVYIPSAKNGLVRDHYKSLGFRPVGNTEEGVTTWQLDIETYKPFEVPIEITELVTHG